MLHHITDWVSRLFRTNRPQTFKSAVRSRGTARLQLEMLEERETPSVNFGFAVGGDTSGSAQSNAVATDAAGNVYVTGSFSGTVHFSGTTLTAQGSTDAFVAKYTSTGTLS